MDLLFSLIIPVFNSEKHLFDTLNSIYKQTYSNFEVIIVDDGSTDSSKEKAECFSKKDYRFHLFEKENGGVSSARNLGIKKAKGDFLLFVDSDDEIDEDLLKSLNAILYNQRYDAVIYGMSFDIMKNGSIIKSMTKSVQSFELTKENRDSNIRLLYENNYLTSSCNKAIKTSILREYNLFFNESITNYEDLLFNLELLKKTTSVYICEKVYYHYFLREELGMSRKYKSTLTASIRITIESLHKTINTSNYSDEAQLFLLNEMQKVFWISLSNICRGNFSFKYKKNQIEDICKKEWVRKNLNFNYLNNTYNDVSVFCFKHKMWNILTLWNMFSNYYRDKKY